MYLGLNISHDASAAILEKDGSENTFIWGVLSAFKDITGYAVLVNTSLNVHEEPINYCLKDSLSAMERDAFDVLYVDGFRISWRETI